MKVDKPKIINGSKWLVFIVLMLTLIIKVLAVFVVPIDSDEVMWAVMADRIQYFGEHYLFFTDQNFRGSADAYILLLFKVMFGLNYITLRIPGILLGTLVTICVFITARRITGNSIFAFLVSFLYLFPLPDVFAVQVKSWGSYILIQLTMLLSYIFADEFSKRPKLAKYVALGMLMGFSFWANEQSIYFTSVVLLYALVVDLLSAKKLFIVENTYDSFSRKVLPLFIWVPLAGIVAFCFLFIAKKRMVFNPILTLVSKLNITSLEPYVSNYNIKLFYIIIFTLILLIATLVITYLVKKHRKALPWYSMFSVVGSTTLLWYLLNIHYDSFSRVSAQGPKLADSLEFFSTYVGGQMFGVMWPIVFVIGLLGLYFRIKELKLANIQLELIDLFLFSLFCFPLLMILSSPPGLTPTPRYLITWYPVVLVVVAYTFSKLAIVLQRYSVNKYIIPACILLGWALLLTTNANKFLGYRKTVVADEAKAKIMIDQLKNQPDGQCVGSYWDIGKVMFYSGLEIKCYTTNAYRPHYKYLDMYNPSIK